MPVNENVWMRVGNVRYVGVLTTLSIGGCFIEMVDPPEPSTWMRLDFQADGNYGNKVQEIEVIGAYYDALGVGGAIAEGREDNNRAASAVEMPRSRETRITSRVC